MEKKALTAFIIILLAFSLLIADRINKVNFNWGKLPPRDELYLTEWWFESGNWEFSVYSTAPRNCSLCGGPISLSEGERTLAVPQECKGMVELACGKLSVSFSKNQESYGPRRVSFNGGFESSYHGGELSVRAKGQGDFGGYKKLEFYLDGQKVLEPAVMLNGPFDFVERIRVGPGKHSLKILLSDSEIYQTNFDVPGKQFPLELLLILLFSLGIAFLVKSPWREPALFIVSFAVTLTLGLVYQFVLFNNLGMPSWLLPGVYGGIELILWESRKRR